MEGDGDRQSMIYYYKGHHVGAVILVTKLTVLFKLVKGASTYNVPHAS